MAYSFGLLFPHILREKRRAGQSLPAMSDQESYAVQGKAIDEPFQNDEKPFEAKDLEPFGNEETAEVKYRTMKWWYVTRSGV